MGWHTQNFLRSNNVERLLDIAGLAPNDLVVDLGAGHGELTQRLARRCRRVIAVEQDPRLADVLRTRFADQPRVVVREQDLLETRLPREPYKVVANIPFDGTARVLSRLTSARHAPESAHLVVQRQAAERMVGWPHQTLFGLVREPWFEPRIVHRFRRTDFAPPPRVDVVFLRLRKRGPPLVCDAQREAFRAFVTYCFYARGPSVACTLEVLLGYERTRRIARSARLPLEARPSDVPLDIWVAVFRAVADDVALRRRLGQFRPPRRRLP